MGDDDDFVHRVGEQVADHVGKATKVMLAGLAFLLNGNMPVARTPPKG